MVITTSIFSFTYDELECFDTNFSIWSQLNHEERSAEGDTPYTREEQQEIFAKMFHNKA